MAFSDQQSRTIPVKAHTRTLQPRIQPQTKTPAVPRPPAKGLTPTVSQKPTRPTITAPKARPVQPAALTPEQIVDQSLQGLRDQLNTQYQSRIGVGQQAFQTLAKQLVDMLNAQAPQIQGDYQRAITNQNQIGQYADQAMLAANPNASLQGTLQAIGAPAEQQSQLAAQLNNVFAGGGAVSQGLQGYVPATKLNEDMLAELLHARSLPGIAALGAQQDFGSYLSQQGKTLADQMFQVNMQKPSLLQQASSAQQGKIFGSGTTGYFTLAPDGRVRRLTQPGQKLASKFISRPDGIYRVEPNGAITQIWKGAAKPARIVGSGSQGFYRVNPDGTVTQVRAPNPKATGAGKAKGLQNTTINGHVVTFDPNTGAYYIPGTITPVDPNSFTAPAKVDAKQLAAARQYLFASANGYWALRSDPEVRLTPSEVVKAQKANPGTIIKTGVAQHEDQEIQRLYITLVQKYGIPARRAFDMVAGQYRQWGQAHRQAYFPKASAAADGGIAENTAYVTLAPGADRQGVATQPAVLDFVGGLGKAYGQRLTIGTGSNHNEYVQGSNRVSAHWSGDAADVPATGVKLRRLGYLALVQAGMSPQNAAQAAATGGLFNVGPYQIIFASSIGGNHYNHLHVGVRDTGNRS